MWLFVWLLGAIQMLEQEAQAQGPATERGGDQSWLNHLLLLQSVEKENVKLPSIMPNFRTFPF